MLNFRLFNRKNSKESTTAKGNGGNGGGEDKNGCPKHTICGVAACTLHKVYVNCALFKGLTPKAEEYINTSVRTNGEQD